MLCTEQFVKIDNNSMTLIMDNTSYKAILGDYLYRLDIFSFMFN